ncbi:DUF2939 domain-containing protein [Thermus filiformis]|uniref:DUF2939 domain-containing protein n=1 Tax=Thermus filiformis TaxID=276 RepID=A0A0A2WNV0_THEFI|nr:DUF2939 domain-containing protein [Thermus filiformis]KGQ21493.1 hypothetical protein THFILI_01900 [Thermus filiformis]
MKKTRLALLVLVPLLLLGAYVWASPYLFLRSLQSAVLAGDQARLERLVDFPRVRQGLKAELHAGLLKQVGEEANPFAGLAYLFAAGLLDAFVDALLTPEGLASLGTGQEPGQAPKEAVRDWRLAYQGFRLAYIYPKDDPNSRLYLERQGLWGWRVVRLQVPLE